MTSLETKTCLLCRAHNDNKN